MRVLDEIQKIKITIFIPISSHNKLSFKFKFIVQNTIITAIVCIDIIFN